MIECNTQEKGEVKSEVFNMDCIEYMKSLPDDAFDLAIVDPPYGIGSVTYMPSTRTHTPGGFIDKYDIVVATLDSKKQRPSVKVNVEYSVLSKATIRGFGDNNVSPSPVYFKELFRVSKNQIIWGGNYFLLPPSRGFIVWDKCVSEKFSMSMAEYAWTSFNCNSKIFKGQSMGNVKHPRIHPTQKPVALYDFILKYFAKTGDSVLDTHLGSGSSRISCYKAGLDFVGLEIDKAYYDASCKRFSAFLQEQKDKDALFNTVSQ